MKLLEKAMGQQEFASRWEASREKMYRFAYCYVKNEHDALEIVSEATCKAFASLHQLHSPEYFETWMGQIIIRTAIDYIKKQRRCQPDFQIDEEGDDGYGDTDSYEQAEIRIDVYAALDAILPEERSYVILKYFEEKSFQEIGQIMGVPEATVKTRVYRSLKKMRSYLKKSEGTT